jgi:azurin
MKNLFVVTVMAVALFVMACGNNKEKKSETPSETPSAGKNLSNNVELTANDSMKFNTIEIDVKANEPVKLTLSNVGKMPKVSMAHNWILLKDGTDLPAFVKEAANAPDHIPTGDSSMIAHTKLLGPGESDTIEFTVPPGSYTYICSFPGHYQTMTGVLTAE